MHVATQGSPPSATQTSAGASSNTLVLFRLKISSTAEEKQPRWRQGFFVQGDNPGVYNPNILS